jgi:hypothetical protein
MSSIDATPLKSAHRHVLLEVAHRAIAWGLANEGALELDPQAFDAPLQEPKGCFVTLHLGDLLRGCVGCLRARGPLVREVAGAAHGAAFRDPRFPPLGAAELEALTVHVSVLSVPVALAFANERELLAQLRPGTDGLVLSDGSRLATFLPEVWDRFPDPAEFLRQLRVKAGFAPDHWSDTLEVERYTTDAFG